MQVADFIVKAFEQKRTLKTRDGRDEIELLKVDAGAGWPVIGYSKCRDKLVRFQPDGRFGCHGERNLDLVPPTRTITRFENVYPNPMPSDLCAYGDHYSTREEANSAAGPSRIACIEVTYEIPEEPC